MVTQAAMIDAGDRLLMPTAMLLMGTVISIPKSSPSAPPRTSCTRSTQ